MKQFLITVAGTMVGFALVVLLPLLFLITLGINAALSNIGTRPEQNVHQAQVIRIDLRQAMRDQPQPQMLQNKPSLLGLVEKLSAAQQDKNVKGLFIRANPFSMQPAHAEEIRGAIGRFQATGKFVIVHAQGFVGTSIIPYLSVSAADEIWMQDTSSFAASGLASESKFYGGLLERFKAKPEFEQFYEFKSAANTYTQKTFTAAHRTSTLSWMNSIFDSAMEQIAKDRSMSRAQLQAITNTAPFSAQHAVQSGLADKLGHVIDAKEAALAKAGNGTFINLADYIAPRGKKGDHPVIALIEGEGAILTGQTEYNPFRVSPIRSDTMANAILAASANNKVKAILIRVNSPGGSPTASDQILNAIARAKANDKKIIISMGQLAASGGYYISANADAIVANAATLTGSIGVLGGKLVFDETYHLLDYNEEQLKVGGEFAGAYSSVTSFTPTQRAAFRANMAKTYEDFTSKVAAGRHMELDRVLEIAKGRVWTGAQALDLGLVDALGGYHEAIAKTKELLDLAPDAPISIRRYPAPMNPWEQFFGLANSSVEMAKMMSTLQQLSETKQVRTVLQAHEAAQQNPIELHVQIPEIK